MKRSLRGIAVATLIAVPNLVMAQASCPSGTVAFPSGGPNTLTAVLTGNTMCATRGADRWQEYHQSGGTLIDFKLGAGHPVDPTETVGTWTSSNPNSTVTHNYGAGGVFTWLVSKPPSAAGPLTLVSTGAAGTVTGVTMIAGGPSKCP